MLSSGVSQEARSAQKKVRQYHAARTHPRERFWRRGSRLYDSLNSSARTAHTVRRQMPELRRSSL
jgi:hypothetical protein